MSAPTVLVAVASRHGATADLARALGAALTEQGLRADVADVADVTALDGYDAVVLGSAIYMGRWLKPATAFVERHAAELRARPTWLFSSGPLGDPPVPAEPDLSALGRTISATGARGHRVFAGKLDRGVLGLAERAIVHAVKAPAGDFRDPEALHGWAAEIAAALEGDRAA